MLFSCVGMYNHLSRVGLFVDKIFGRSAIKEAANRKRLVGVCWRVLFIV